MPREVIRNGVRGHVVKVAPREGYERFVPHKYEKSRRGPVHPR